VLVNPLGEPDIAVDGGYVTVADGACAGETIELVDPNPPVPPDPDTGFPTEGGFVGNTECTDGTTLSVFLNFDGSDISLGINQGGGGTTNTGFGPEPIDVAPDGSFGHIIAMRTYEGTITPEGATVTVLDGPCADIPIELLEEH